jgi:uncharacterized membrane protein (UPF0127 family)
MRKLLQASLLTALILPASTFAATPLIFKKLELTLVSYGPAPDAPKPEAPDPRFDAPAEPQPAAAPSPRAFKILAQLRPASALQQQDMFSINPFFNAQAHLFLFDPPTLTAFRAPSIQKAVDLIALNENGIIIEIVPNAVPADLDPSQYSVEQPVRALLLVQAGTVDANGIRPGDKVQQSEIFNQPPEKRR